MKKHLLTLTLLASSISLFAQVSCPNGNFEQWTSGTYENPTFYPFGTNPSAFFKCNTPFNVTKITDVYHGAYAVQVTTNASVTDTCGGYFINTNTSSGNPNTWKGGMPYAQIPTGIRGYFKYNVANTDSALIIISFRLNNASIGLYVFNLSGIHNTYTLFDKPLVPALTQAPDSVIIGFAASDMVNNNGVPGSTLKLDSISFTGVVSQPANMNGDMELWTSNTLYNPTTWYEQIDNEGNGVNRTTDKYAGLYACEMKTYLGDNNGNPRANPGGVSTGYWANSCGCQKGGRPFTNQIDTLCFYYKYVPAIAGDSGNLNLQFKLNTVNVSNSGMNLHPTGVYLYQEVPFNIGSPIDSVIVGFQSARWTDTALTHIGGDLKVDEVHFKSQPLSTGISKYAHDQKIFVYPNPSKDVFTIDVNDGSVMQSMIVYDLTGKIILDRNCEHLTNFAETIDMSKFTSGSYIVEVVTANGIYRKKISKVE